MVQRFRVESLLSESKSHLPRTIREHRQDEERNQDPGGKSYNVSCSLALENRDPTR